MLFLKELGWGIVVFGLVIGVGLVVLSKFASTTAGCATTHTYNASSGYCTNSTGGDLQSPSTGTQSVNYVMTQLGSSGLAGWIGIVIVIVLGAWAIASFGGFGGRK